jgi:glucose-1-phosphate cytidylyltransferase|tara:strand:+ start:271 stop:1068 length:798 start_codon:yes stop_codon:yes gene_type:complete
MQKKNLSVILLVGGKGTRLSNIQKKEKQHPKALQKINSKVLISHSMSNFLKYNYNNFILPIGSYKNIFFNFFKNKKFFCGKKCKIFFSSNDYIKALAKNRNRINILLLYTGLNVNKANRTMKVINKLNLQEFILSYGDGVGDINIDNLHKEHRQSKCFMTVAGIIPYSQYGHFVFDKKNKMVVDFLEKPKLSNWANIGYFFVKKEAIRYFKKYKDYDLEAGVVKSIAKENKLLLYKHKGFWKSVDTLKDLNELSIFLKKNKILFI